MGYTPVIVLLLALSGCGGGSSDSGSSSGGSDSGNGSGAGGGDGAAAAPELDKAVSDDQVKLEWSQVKEADAYNLYYATEGGIKPANFQVWRNEHNGEKVPGVKGGSHTVEKVKAGKTYHFVLTAVNDGQESRPSNEVTATPEDSGPQFSKLNDTGVRFCNKSRGGEGQGRGGSGGCPQGGHPNQDAEVGRDAAAKAGELDKEGAGKAGFDFTKIDTKGNELPADAEEWTCVRDNHTGLMWEVKRSGKGMRGIRATYSWYDPDDPTYGDGVPNNGSDCGGIPCDTHHYVQAVNDQGLCGASDWRLPSVNELHSISVMNSSGMSAADGARMDTDFFPNAHPNVTWTGTPAARGRNTAWTVTPYEGTDGFPNASPGQGACSIGLAARLVREVEDTETPTTPASASARGERIPAADSCVGNLSPTTPSSEFTALEGGAVVRHEATGLEWRRCPAGMEWNGQTCSGSAKTMTWKAALQYAGDKDGWRLPNMNELRSIVERCRKGPAVNQEVFPETGSAEYYTSSAARQKTERGSGFKAPSGAWTVDFNTGLSEFTRDFNDYDDRFGPPPSPKKVRLVRFAD
jgi:hypothetical protein